MLLWMSSRRRKVSRFDAVGGEDVVDLAGDESREAADDVLVRESLGGDSSRFYGQLQSCSCGGWEVASATLELLTDDPTGDALDLRWGNDSRVLLHGLAQQPPHQRGDRYVFGISALPQLLIELSVDAQMHRHIQRGCLLDRFGLGGLSFFTGDLRQDRSVSRAARHLLMISLDLLLTAGAGGFLIHQRRPLSFHG